MEMEEKTENEKIWFSSTTAQNCLLTFASSHLVKRAGNGESIAFQRFPTKRDMLSLNLTSPLTRRACKYGK